MTRPKPDHIDRVIDQTLTQCTRCQSPLGSPVAVSEHLQEDLIPARVEVTRFRHHRYGCPGCRKIVTAPPAADEIPDSYLGPQVLTHALLFKCVHGLPFNKIQTAFQQMGNLTVSEGGLAQALQRMARWLKIETEELLQAIRSSSAVHVGETGWKITGKNHWLWAFVTERLIRPHVIIRNRSYPWCRSPTGAITHSDLIRWIQTLALQGRAIGPTLGRAYALHRQRDPVPLPLVPT